MDKVKSMLTIVCLCLMSGIEAKSYAGPIIKPADLKEQMQEHIKKVKLKNPAEHQSMVDKAGGNITDCVSCHIDINNKKNSSNNQPSSK